MRIDWMEGVPTARAVGPWGSPLSNPTGVVIHAMGEFVQGYWAPQFLADRGLHAHAFVTPSGVIVYQTPEDRRGAHARGFNDCLGIEILVPGRVDDIEDLYKRIAVPGWYTEAQWDSAIRLTTHWAAKYKIPPERVVRHSDIDPGRKRDPGEGFPWGWFRGGLKRRLEHGGRGTA